MLSGFSLFSHNAFNKIMKSFSNLAFLNTFTKVLDILLISWAKWLSSFGFVSKSLVLLGFFRGIFCGVDVNFLFLDDGFSVNGVIVGPGVSKLTLEVGVIWSGVSILLDLHGIWIVSINVLLGVPWCRSGKTCGVSPRCGGLMQGMGVPKLFPGVFILLSMKDVVTLVMESDVVTPDNLGWTLTIVSKSLDWLKNVSMASPWFGPCVEGVTFPWHGSCVDVAWRGVGIRLFRFFDTYKDSFLRLALFVVLQKRHAYLIWGSI